MQTTGLAPTHTPDWHVSTWLHALPSLQAVPFGTSGFVQAPVPVLQVPAAWHWSEGAQTTALPPVHTPDWHVSSCVQALPSLQAVPLGVLGFEHNPVVASQVPAR